MSLLEVSQLAVSYGGIQAVKGVDLHVEQGELVCLIGANGAGKSTLLKALCGLLPTAQGSVLYDGQELTGQPVHTIARLGLALVPEGRGIFGRMSVAENLDMAGGEEARRAAWRFARDADDHTDRQSEDPGHERELERDQHRRADLLGIGSAPEDGPVEPAWHGVAAATVPARRSWRS